ncbi:MAG: hypothetical protein GY804_01980 [Alphaproteobacteria bacterium]|nr:hypothetical protein [Alphaproteobacteria bacterium]
MAVLISYTFISIKESKQQTRNYIRDIAYAATDIQDIENVLWNLKTITYVNEKNFSDEKIDENIIRIEIAKIAYNDLKKRCNNYFDRFDGGIVVALTSLDKRLRHIFYKFENSDTMEFNQYDIVTINNAHKNAVYLSSVFNHLNKKENYIRIISQIIAVGVEQKNIEHNTPKARTNN